MSNRRRYAIENTGDGVWAVVDTKAKPGEPRHVSAHGTRALARAEAAERNEPDGPRYYADPDLDPSALAVAKMEGWVGIVDEKAGGYIAYAGNKDVAAVIVKALRQKWA